MAPPTITILGMRTTDATPHSDAQARILRSTTEQCFRMLIVDSLTLESLMWTTTTELTTVSISCIMATIGIAPIVRKKYHITSIGPALEILKYIQANQAFKTKHGLRGLALPSMDTRDAAL